LRAGGTLSSDAATQALRRAMTEPDLATMRGSIESMYRSLGVSITAPAFEEWIDADASGHLPRRVRDMPGLALDDVADAQALSVLTSNAVTVRTAPGEYVYVEADSGSTIVRNGEPIGFHRTQATDGDTLALQRTAPGFSSSAQGMLVVGATRLAWNIRTRTPVVEFVSKVGAACPFLEVWGNSDPGHGEWHALPLQPDRALRLDMIALEGYSIESFKRVSIHANGGDDRPGARLATTQTLQRHFDGVTIPVAGSDSRFGDRSLGAASYPSVNVGEWDFGVPGPALQAGVRYWIVLEGYDPFYLDGPSSVMGEPPFGAYLVSADGSTWKYPARTYRCPGQPDLVRTLIPRVYLID
jgi:hypothetical protein